MASSHTSLRFKTQKGAVLIRILTQAHVSLTNKVKTVHDKQYKNEVSQWQLTKIKMIMKQQNKTQKYLRIKCYLLCQSYLSQLGHGLLGCHPGVHSIISSSYSLKSLLISQNKSSIWVQGMIWQKRAADREKKNFSNFKKWLNNHRQK